ncbi:LacI family DNA-binding transcriptional regulator [Pedobacter sp. GR22-6]|uniref:LacI family DNA-binding transcriptional regulator n=1 Tax=Pedobacter sp. GR22-6 TaxID=3127957 RepID=UPI00307E6EEB
MKKKVSIKDIAKQLGISISTVSFVVNGKAKEKRISEELTKKVLQLVDELDYKPDALARSFRTGKTNIIGFLVDDISEPFFSGIARFIDEKAAKKGYKIIYSSTRNNRKKAVELLQIFQDRHVDGYIIALPEGTEDEVQALTGSGKPVILFDRYFPGLKTDYVIINNRESTFNAAAHLADNGYKNIGFVTIDTVEQQMLDRLKGYEDGVKARGLRANVIKIPYSNASNSRDQIIEYLKGHPQLDAVIFAANYLSMDGLRAIQRLGLQIPGDLAVVSFDDFELLEFAATTISAIAQPLEKIAEEIMSILLRRLEAPDNESGFHQVVLPTEFNIRKSSLGKV